jgi:hypothetical protein
LGILAIVSENATVFGLSDAGRDTDKRIDRLLVFDTESGFAVIQKDSGWGLRVECSFAILVLRTRSEAIGSDLQPEAKKFEARNIRISDLRQLQGFMPSGRNPKPGPPGPDLY